MTKPEIKIINSFFFFVVNVILSAIPLSCRPDMEEAKNVSSHGNRPVEISSDIEFVYTDSGLPRIKLTAAELLRFAGDEPYIEMPKGVRLVFYNTRMEPESWISADYGINYEKKRIMEAQGNVVVVNSKGEKLNTEHLTWSEEKKMIYTDEFVKITTPDEIIMGNGMEANQDFTKFKIKNIKGTIQIKENDSTGSSAGK